MASPFLQLGCFCTGVHHFTTILIILTIIVRGMYNMTGYWLSYCIALPPAHCIKYLELTSLFLYNNILYDFLNFLYSELMVQCNIQCNICLHIIDKFYQLLIFIVLSCPQEVDTVWNIEWSETNVGSLATGSCPGSFDSAGIFTYWCTWLSTIGLEIILWFSIWL